MNRLRQKSSVISERIDNRFVLCDLDTGEIYESDGLGADIWCACKGLSVEECASRIRRMHPDVPVPRIAEAVAWFVTQAVDAGILHIDGG